MGIPTLKVKVFLDFFLDIFFLFLIHTKRTFLIYIFVQKKISKKNPPKIQIFDEVNIKKIPKLISQIFFGIFLDGSSLPICTVGVEPRLVDASHHLHRYYWFLNSK